MCSALLSKKALLKRACALPCSPLLPLVSLPLPLSPETTRTSELSNHAHSYKWAIKLSPRWVDGYYNLGNLLLGTNQVEKAIERLQVAVKLDPAHLKAQAKLKHAQKELDAKVEAFKEQVDNAINKAQKMMDRGEL
jgi:hypothetical protein